MPFATTRFTVSPSGFEATLNVTAGQYADSGEYRCTVVITSLGGNQTLTSTFYFEVKGKRKLSVMRKLHAPLSYILVEMLLHMMSIL